MFVFVITNGSKHGTNCLYFKQFDFTLL